MGEGDYGRIPKGFCPLFDFGEEGKPSHDFSYFFHIFFYHMFLVSNCSLFFCVKQMGSTVLVGQEYLCLENTKQRSYSNIMLQ